MIVLFVPIISAVPINHSKYAPALSFSTGYVNYRKVKISSYKA